MVFSKQYRRLQCATEMLSDGSPTLIKALLQTQMRMLALIMISVVVSGCTLFGDDEIATDTLSGEQQMYREAQRYIASSSYDLAIATLQSLESRYPFGKFAEQAQLELIFAYHGAFQNEAAIEAADRFIRLHPTHPDVDYAFYMKGVAAYDLTEDFLSGLIPSDDSKRDVSRARESFAEFSQLIARYPNSRYAPDARARMIYLRNMLARHEIHVANYYFRRGAYMAALKRGQNVVENMQQSTAVADGLAVMAQAYALMNLDDLAQDTLSVLCVNYPEHPMLEENCSIATEFRFDKLEHSWINRASFGLFDPPKPPQFDYRPTVVDSESDDGSWWPF
jgi:outer membrane protein assembly factor BamD